MQLPVFASKRGVLVSIAVVLIIAILATGTFAWQSISQQALNPATGGPSAPLPEGSTGGRLRDDYEVVDEWYEGRRANKDVYIENFGIADYDEPIFVRNRLYEFMGLSETAWPSINQVADRVDFLAHDHASLVYGAQLGDFTTWTPRLNWAPCLVDAAANITDDTLASYDPFRRYFEWELGGQKYFMPTFNRDPNSNQSDVTGDAIDPQAVHNNPTERNDSLPWPRVREDGFPGQAGNENFWSPDNPDWGDVAPYWWAHERQPNGVESTNRVQHEARPTLNARVILMADWIAADSPISWTEGETTGNFWVVDVDGWAYWSAPLYPGEATGLLLSSITLHNVPDDYWYYAIFIDAEMATADYWYRGSAASGTHGAVDGWFNASNIARERAPSDDAVTLMNLITAPYRTPVEVTP